MRKEKLLLSNINFATIMCCVKDKISSHFVCTKKYTQYKSAEMNIENKTFRFGKELKLFRLLY